VFLLIIIGKILPLQITSIAESSDTPYAEMESRVKQKKLEQAGKFISSILSDDILFAGVSGSVSYVPEPEDDIDIYLITRSNRLWRVLLKSFIVCRITENNDICLSLAFDHEYAVEYYRSFISGLAAKDSVHVIPFAGLEYYQGLLHSSPEIMTTYQKRENSTTESAPVSLGQGSRLSLIDLLLYVIVSSWLHLKSLYRNKKFDRKNMPGDKFQTVTGLHRFYLKTVKYEELDRKFREGYR